METSSTLVIKVKYGDMLRRVSYQFINGALELSMDGLRKKIITLFNLDANAELVLTYIDEDGDVITLVDDDDIRDVVKQALNPLRVTVKLTAGKNSSGDTSSTGSSTPLRSPGVRPSLQNPVAGASGLLRNVPEPVQQLLVKISSELAAKASAASSSTPVATELVDYFAKLGLSYLTQNLESQPQEEQLNTSSGVLKNTAAAESKERDCFKGDPVSSSAPGGTELEEYYKLLGSSHLDQSLESQGQPTTQCGVPGTAAATVAKVSELYKDNPAATLKTLSNLRNGLSTRSNENLNKLNLGAAIDKKEANIPSLTGGSVDNSLFNFTAEAEPLNSRNINAVQPEDCALLNPSPAPVHPKSGLPKVAGNKDKAKKVVECYSSGKAPLPSHLPHVPIDLEKNDRSSSGIPSAANKNIPIREMVNDLNEPNLDSDCIIVGGSDPKSREYVDVRGKSVLPNDLGKSPILEWPILSTNECPFSGISMGDVAAAPPQPHAVALPLGRRGDQNDGSRNIFHRGVRCDGCGIHPIVGARFKSKVKVDYDLCSTCFERLGNGNDYIRMDFPMAYQGHVPFKGFLGPQARNKRPNLPQFYRGCKVKSVGAKLDSSFIEDVNVIDGTAMPPSTPFTKIWRMKNNGAIPWHQGTQLVWIGGDKLSNAFSFDLEIPVGAVSMNEEIDVAVDFISPELPGRYISYWRMASPSGQKFGQRVWVLIQVDDSIKEPPPENMRNLNLNLPPVSNSTDPEIINVNPEAIAEEYNLPKPIKSKMPVEAVPPNTDNELKFPINDSLLVGNSLASSSTKTPISYPIIDLPDITLPPLPEITLPPLPSVPPLLYPLPLPQPTVPTLPVASPLQLEVDEENQVEEKLLRELEEMGFAQLDLNREVLRMNNYDLEKAVDDLCGVTEWDPMLDELQKMGFHDRELSKKLLKKNNGSIKRVVMDLIAGEMN